MIKKIIGTAILMIPLITGAISVSGVDIVVLNDLFNSSNTIESGGNFGHMVDITVNSDDIDIVMPGLNVLFLLIIAMFGTAPFGYAGKGTFIFGKIRIVGFAIRILVLLILLFVPTILSALSHLGISSEDVNYVSFTMSCILIGFALIGLGIRS